MHLRSLSITLAVVLHYTPLFAQGWTFEDIGSIVYFDLAVESSGTPHIVFTNCTHREVCFDSPAPRYLIHATRTGTSWTYDTLSLDPAGFTPAITLDDTAGVHVAYMDSLTDLQYIYGATGGPWTKEALPHSNPNFLRNEPDIAVDDTGGVHISYNQAERPWYQYRSAMGWVEEQVSFNFGDNDISRSSIKVGGDGIVRIASWSFATWGVVYERIGGIWTENVIGMEEGQYPSLALDTADSAHILYTGSSGTIYATNKTGPWTEKVLEPAGHYGDIVLEGDNVPIVAYGAGVVFFDSVLYYDVDLYVSVQVDSFWQRQSLVSYQTPVFSSVGFNFRPRLALDDVGDLHIAYRNPLTGDLVYGFRKVPTGIDRPLTVPGRPELYAAPNPFNPSTTVYYSVPSAGRVQIDVYDVRGRRVRALLNREQSEGPHSVRWDGRNDRGSTLGSGVYFVRLKSSVGVVTRRVVLLK